MADFTIRAEQRCRRSDEVQKALIFQLEHIREECDMDLVVLADHNGLVVASAGDKRAAKVFAVYAQALAGGDEPHPALSAVMPDLDPDRIVCESLTLDDLPLHLCAVMDMNDESLAAFERACTGVQRIYYTTGEFTQPFSSS